MATAQAIINGALRALGALPEAGSASPERSTEALETLNDMLDLWQIDDYLIFTEQIVKKVLTPGKADYTIGAASTSPDITATRPTTLLGAYMTVNGVDYPPMTILTDEQYAEIPVKTTQSPTPDSINFAAEYPKAKVTTYPVPSAANTLNLRLQTPLTSFASLSTDVAMPPGYKLAVQLNLALLLAPSEEKEPSRELREQAINAKALCKTKNLQNALVLSSLESTMLAGGGSGNAFDFNTGEYR